MENEAAIRELLTEAHGIVEKEKLGDWIGHVTCRIPPGDRILIKPQWVRLGGLRPKDFLVVDLEGKVLDWGAGDPARKGFNPPSEWPLHTEIYLAREDVQAVAHTHPLVATAMTAGMRLATTDEKIIGRSVTTDGCNASSPTPPWARGPAGKWARARRVAWQTDH